MHSDYDENLRNNIFFKEIVENHSDIIKKASSENWLICIPRTGTVEAKEIEINTILDHILVPQEDGILKNYLTCTTLSKKKLKIRKNRIFIDDNRFAYCDVINILFKETFYEEKSKKYTVWCIDKLLYLDNHFNPQLELKKLESLPDCIDFLWVESEGQEILQQIKNLCTKFKENTINYENEHLQSQKDLIGSLYSQCLQKTLRNNLIREKASKSEQFLEKLKLAVETYMQYCVGKKVLFGITTFMVQSDVYLNKIIKKAENVEDKDLGIISVNYYDVIPCGKNELSKLNNCLTILDKVNCLDRTFNILCGNRDDLVTSDDLLQMFVCLILRVNIYNWVSNLTFLKDFKFCTSTFTDHVNYLLTTLEASIEYIKGSHFKTLTKRIDISKENNIFSLVRVSDLNKLKDLFKNNKDEDTKLEKLCHPLCVCKNCEHISKSLFNDKEIKNDKDQTLLIYAAIFEKVEIIEYLLNEDVNSNSRDCFGKSALHYACEKGNQDIIILLLMSRNDLDVNAKDNINGDTPLHLATSKGHENCVKALIYSASNLNTNVCNFNKETPLHLAAKLGYFLIVRILLDNSSSFLSEKEMRSVLTVCHNYSIKNYIEQFSIKKVLPSFAFGSRNQYNSIANHGIKSKSTEELKKLNLLINAIKNNDFPLTCFYLGFDHTKQTDFLTNKCHPLCDCENCQNLKVVDVQESNNYSLDEDDVNVNMCNMEGYTPLHVASQYGRTSILRVLLDCGAQVNLQTYKKFYSPLHLACLFQQISVVKELLKCSDCDVNIRDFNGNTPLFYACFKNDCRIIEILLENDANYDLRNYKGDTVWDVCQRKMLYCAFKTLKNNIRFSNIIE